MRLGQLCPILGGHEVKGKTPMSIHHALSIAAVAIMLVLLVGCGPAQPTPSAALEPPPTPTQEFLSAAWKAFLFGLLIFWLLALALIAGRMAACDAIDRSALIRFLYFLYGAIFFPLVIPYYIYRYFKGTFPYTGYGLLPLYEGATSNVFLRPFSYIADANVAAKKEAFLKAGRALIA